MLNFPGASVFPGGSVDHRDYDPRIPWARSPAEMGIHGLEPVDARAAVSAAIRETFEESAILFAGPAGDSEESWQPPDADHDRQVLEAHRVDFAELLSMRGVGLRPDLLAYWGAWITPEFQPVRFDARFFFAEVPPGLVARAASTESLDGDWVPVRQAITQADRGAMQLMPPTYITCLDLYRFTRAADAIAMLRSTDRPTVSPRLVMQRAGVELRIPDRFSELNEAVHAELAIEQATGV